MDLNMPVFSSTIIPTINRSTLSRAVHSILDQDFEVEDFEVIVVNDSGSPLPEMEWMHSGRVHVIETNRHEIFWPSRVTRCQRLEAMKHSEITDGPGNKRSEREDGQNYAGCDHCTNRLLLP